MRCIQIGLLCVQESAMDRLTILAIIFMLGNNFALPFPKRPAFISKTHKGEDLSYSSKGLLSINDVTITLPEPRWMLTISIYLPWQGIVYTCH